MNAECNSSSGIRVSSLLSAGLSGLLAASAFPATSLVPAIFFALVPLLLVARSSKPTAALLFGWIAGAIGNGSVCWWVLGAIARFEHISAVQALPFFLLFVAYQALPLALFAGGVAWVGSSRPSGISRQLALHVIFPAAWWVLLEWAFPKIIPWSLGDVLAASPLLRQSADVAGVYGLSFVVVLVNAALAAALVHRDMPLLRRMQPAATGAALLGVVAGYGAFRIGQVDSLCHDTSHDHDHALLVAIVQGGLRSGREDVAAANEEAWRLYSSLSTQDSALSTDLIVWPETVLRVYLQHDASWYNRLVRFIEQIGRPLLLGSLDLPGRGAGELNSGYLMQPANITHSDVHPTGTLPQGPPVWQVYHKRTLLPFGEYVPGASWLPLLTRWRTTGRFVAAESFHPLALTRSRPRTEAEGERSPGARTTILLAPSICFEAILPGVFNQAIRDGAQFLVNITDDGWFGDTAAPYLHLNAATMRAVETRRWLVRASNSGVSAFVDPTGEIVASMPLGTVGVVRQRITTSNVVPLYARWGNWPIPLCALVVALCFGSTLRGPGTYGSM